MYADITISTAHKAKGREWNTVRISSDFAPEDTCETDVSGQPTAAPIDADEARLAYVAVTRARHHLDHRGLSAAASPVAHRGTTPWILPCDEAACEVRAAHWKRGSSPPTGRDFPRVGERCQTTGEALPQRAPERTQPPCPSLRPVFIRLRQTVDTPEAEHARTGDEALPQPHPSSHGGRAIGRRAHPAPAIRELCARRRHKKDPPFRAPTTTERACW
ncbi:3'-5' exonuclease [Streptomyces xiamenensis]